MTMQTQEHGLQAACAEPQMIEGHGGVRIAAYEWGNPQGYPILLIHGVAQCHLCFTPQINSELASEFRLVALDLRGHGASDKPQDMQAYRHESAYADDIDAVIRAKALQRPVAVGWSMGGRVLRQYLMRYGDQALGGINFVCSRVIEAAHSKGPATPGQQPQGNLPLARQIQEAIAFLDACYHAKPAQDLYELALCYNMIVAPLVRKACTGWTTDPAATVAELRKVRVPTLVTQGRLDAVVQPQAADLIMQAIPHARTSWFEECGHSPFQEDPGRFNRELAAFAREVRG